MCPGKSGKEAAVTASVAGSLKAAMVFSKRKIKSIESFFLPESSPPSMDDESKVKEIRFEGRYYNVTNWVKHHPGGRVIDFYTQGGEDATEAIKQFHYRSSDKVLKLLKGLKSRPAKSSAISERRDRNYEEMSADFEKLTREFEAEGLFEPSWIYTGIRLVEIFILVLASAWLGFFMEDKNIATVLGGSILAITMLRVGYFTHEAGHYSMSGWTELDKGISGTIFALCVGLSGSWWRSHHNRHHAMPQRIERDVNLNTMPFMAYNVESTKHESRTNIFPFSFFLRHQAKMFVPALSLGGFLGWKVWFTPKHILTHDGKYHEFALLAVHYFLAYLIGFWTYGLASVIFAALILLTFDLSHTHMPVAREPRHWVEYAMIHTINVDSSWFLDWWTGHLNFQIEHHLFPNMPNFRLARTSERVKKLAEKHQLPYVCVSYGNAVKMVFQNLQHVSKELRSP